MSDGKIQDRDCYSAVVHMLGVSETTTWTRFSAFLVFSTILATAWVRLYSQNPPHNFAQFLMIVLSVIGLASGIAWACLGWRGREFVRRFLALGVELEKAATIEAGRGPCQLATNTRDTIRFPWAGSFGILVISPVVVSALFFLLLVASIVG